MFKSVNELDGTMEQLTVVLAQWNRRDLVSVLDALSEVRSGSVEISIHDSRVRRIDLRHNLKHKVTFENTK